MFFLKLLNKGTMSHTRRRFYSEPFPRRNLFIEQALKVLSTQKTFDTRTLCIQTAHRSFYRPTYACRNFTQNSFYTADFFWHRSLDALKKKTRHFLQTESSPHRSLTQSTFYIQTLSHTDAFVRMPLHRHKLHTKHVCTQPTFTQQGFVSPS